MKLQIITLFLLVLISCKKDEENLSINIDQKIYGRWLETASTFTHTQYTRSSRFGEYEKGLVVFDDGTLIERSEGGICVGEYCLMENYYGTYTFDTAKKSLNVSVVNYAGSQKYALDILAVTTDSLKVKKR